MQQLVETYHRLLANLPKLYFRRSYDDFQFKQRLTGIVGARGVGKTTFLFYHLQKHYHNSDKALYISADNLYFSDQTLLAVADQFHKEYAGELLCIDEIHKYANWNQELKNIYDSYPKMKILFTGSSSLDLVKGHYDLSRRAFLQRLSGFSFREFLEYKLDCSFPVLKLEDILKQNYDRSILQTPELLGYFKDYLKSGFYPIFTEIDDLYTYNQLLVNIMNKIIYEDITNFYSLKTQNLNAFHKILYFIATSSPGGISINNIAESLSKDHTTVSSYIEMLRETKLLRYLLNDKKGHSMIRKAEKIYLNNPNLNYAINQEIGKEIDLAATRELFALSSLEDADYKVFYSSKADMKVEDYIFEIGGKNKNSKQIKGLKNAFLLKDDILAASPTTVPLLLLGFLR